MIIKILYLILLTTVNSFLINPYALKSFTTNSKQMLHQTFNDNDYFYFDPNNNMEGSWNSNLGAMKINVERCGCNNAFKGATINVTVLLVSLIVAVYLYLQ